MAKQYTTVENIESYLLIEIEAAFEPEIVQWIEAISLYMDFLANRTLMAGAVDEIYKFDGIGGSQLSVADIQSITSVVVDGVTIATENYYLYPSNSTPKSRIVLQNTSFINGRQNISITGKFGQYADGALPADLTLAATILTAGVVNHGQAKGRKVQSETIGRYSVSYATEKGWNDYERAMHIVRSHRRFSF